MVTNSFLEDSGLLRLRERRPDCDWSDPTRAGLLWLCRSGKRRSNRHRWGLLSNHQTPTDIPAGIVAAIRPKWEGGRGWRDHIPDWSRRRGHVVPQWDESRRYSNDHDAKNWRSQDMEVCVQRAGGADRLLSPSLQVVT